MAVIRIVRKAAPWSNRLAKYWVLMDGEKVGQIANGQTREFSVVPGEHRIQLKVDWAGSPEKVVELREGGVVEFVCGPGGPAIMGLLLLLRPHHYIAFEGPRWPPAGTVPIL